MGWRATHGGGATILFLVFFLSRFLFFFSFFFLVPHSPSRLVWGEHLCVEARWVLIWTWTGQLTISGAARTRHVVVVELWLQREMVFCLQVVV